MGCMIESECIRMFVEGVEQVNPVHMNFLNSSVEMLDEKCFRELDEYLRYCLKSGLGISDVVSAYDLIVRDTMREQLFFLVNKKYRYRRYEDVRASVYFDKEYMSNYMHGLALTTFLWPNHRVIYEFFEKCLSQTECSNYFEIGPGHGYFFMKAVMSGRFHSYYGIDVSPASIEMTDNVLKYYGGELSLIEYKLDVVDFFDVDFLEKDRLIVMSEVLEHVENPEDFIERIRDISSSNCEIYINTVVNTPAIDHIYLFEDPCVVEGMFEKHDLSVVDKLYVPYSGKSYDECVENKFPISVAYLLKVKE